MEDKSYEEVRVGISVFITNENNQVLLGKRIGKHGGGEYGSPGGHMEYGESIIGAAKREVMEEIGVDIDNIEFLRVLNLTHYPPRHYIDIALCAKIKEGQIPRLMEPEKCEGWEWYEITDIPYPYFQGLPSIVEAYLDFRHERRDNIFFD
jgi:8-oxo-dGTP diphosphatase